MINAVDGGVQLPPGPTNTESPPPNCARTICRMAKKAAAKTASSVRLETSGHSPDVGNANSRSKKYRATSRSGRRVAARHRPVACATHRNDHRRFGVRVHNPLAPAGQAVVSAAHLICLSVPRPGPGCFGRWPSPVCSGWLPEIGGSPPRSGPAPGRRCRGGHGRCKSASEKSTIRGCRGGRHPCLPRRAASCRPDQRPIFQRFQSFKAAPAGLEARLHVRQNA